jgi:hypothetical protein
VSVAAIGSNQSGIVVVAGMTLSDYFDATAWRRLLPELGDDIFIACLSYISR